MSPVAVPGLDRLSNSFPVGALLHQDPATLPAGTAASSDSSPHESAIYPDYPRRNNFDLLRLILAYAVVVFHVCYLTGHDRFAPGSLAGVAVGGFFVISGFLLTWSLTRRPKLRAYATKRFFRIYPLYALVMIAQAFILLGESRGRLTGLIHETLRYLAANLAFANFLQPTIGDVLSRLRMNAINGSAWTLKVEIACYALLPLALGMRRRMGQAPTIALTIALAGSPLLLSGLFKQAQTSSYVGLAAYFLTGSALFYLGPYLDRYRRQFLKVAVLGTPLVFILSHWIVALPIVAQFVLGLWVYCFAFTPRTVTLQNDVSYGAYLLHFPIVQIGLLHGWLRHGLAVSLVSVVLVTTLLAWMSFKYVEQPMIRLGHRISRE